MQHFETHLVFLGKLNPEHNEQRSRTAYCE